MPSPKIVLSFLSDASLSDGCVGHTSSLLRSFEEQGCDVTLVALASTEQNRVGGRLFQSFPVSMLGLVRAAWASIVAVRRERADMLICTSLGAPFNPFIAFVARLMGTAVLYDCQDPPIETASLIFGSSPFGKALGLWVTATDRILRRSVNWCFAVSSGVEQILRSHNWKMPVLRFYNNHSADVAADPSESTFRATYGLGDAIVLIYAGGLQPEIRGIELQIEAVTSARAEGRNVKFVAFGTGDPAPFKHLARKRGIVDHVLFPGPVPQREVLAAIRDSDVAVISTVPFALPSKVFEYLACGVRVACSIENRDVIEAFSPIVDVFDGTPIGLSKILTPRAGDNGACSNLSFLGRFESENKASVAHVLTALKA